MMHVGNPYGMTQEELWLAVEERGRLRSEVSRLETALACAKRHGGEEASNAKPVGYVCKDDLFLLAQEGACMLYEQEQYFRLLPPRSQMPLYAHPPKATCPFGDKSCPCVDGDPCHYTGENAWPAPEAPSEAEPVAWMWNQGGTLFSKHPPLEVSEWQWTPLYAHPQQHDEADARLLEAAENVITRWELPLWKNAESTAHFIYRLRDAVEAIRGRDGGGK